MKRKDFIKSLIGLPLLGFWGFDKKQEIKPAHKNLVDGGHDCDHEHVITLKYPGEYAESLRQEMEKIKSSGVFIVDGYDTETRIHEFK